jgi:hypothetical protein
MVGSYNKRGTAEQWIKEAKKALNTTRLSCHRFWSDEVRLWLSASPTTWQTSGSGWRCSRPWAIWSLISLQQRPVKNRRTVDRARLDFITNRQAGAKRLVSFPFNARCAMSLGSPLLWPVSVLGALKTCACVIKCRGGNQNPLEQWKNPHSEPGHHRHQRGIRPVPEHQRMTPFTVGGVAQADTLAAVATRQYEAFRSGHCSSPKTTSPRIREVAAIRTSPAVPIATMNVIQRQSPSRQSANAGS